MLLVMAGPAPAQWVKLPLPDTPRTPDGKPNLTAPAPRTPDGKPDLSGIWTTNTGAYLNNRRIHVSNVRRLEDSLVCTGFPSHKRHLSINVHFYHQLGMATHGVRRSGSAAIDLAYVACGRLDGFWEFGLNPWDMAAGVLLVEEAGGRVSGYDDSKFNVYSPPMLANNGLIHFQMLDVLR